MNYRVFIDGAEGTTGLKIHEYFRKRNDIELIRIDAEKRKDLEARLSCVKKADISFLCLPDMAAKEIAAAAPSDCRILDTSTAHRTNDEWVYGMPELCSGQRDKIRNGNRVAVPVLAEKLSYDGSGNAAEAIMTTDTIAKSVAVEFKTGGKVCRLGGIAKGSGMINPNMATMLSFITTDADITSTMLDKALKEIVQKSFNQICVDGDTSTNDMVVVMANGMAGNRTIENENEDYEVFKAALLFVAAELAKMLARDGEGAGKLIECNVKGAPDDITAQKISKSVISSNLLKAAMFGEDANWGRVLCAVGYTDGDFNTDNIDVKMSSAKGSVTVCEASSHKEYSEEKGSEILSEEHITIDIDMNQGSGYATAWGCDLTYEYVRINGDYRS